VPQALTDSQLAENPHWDVLETILPAAERKNSNGKFQGGIAEAEWLISDFRRRTSRSTGSRKALSVRRGYRSPVISQRLGGCESDP
jgi:hypothetical protein